MVNKLILVGIFVIVLVICIILAIVFVNVLKEDRKLKCDNILQQAKDHYDLEGQWKNVYTMDPWDEEAGFNKVDKNTCDIKYKYTRIGGGQTGYDKRRFTFNRGDGGIWEVDSMGGYQSGVTL